MKLLDIDNFKGNTLQQKYFVFLVNKYCKERYPRASYEKATELSRSSYENLNGVKWCVTTDVLNIVYASYWLCVTYEEAKLLYLLWYCNQIMNVEEYLRWDSIFRMLDERRTELMKMTPFKRVRFVKEIL